MPFFEARGNTRGSDFCSNIAISEDKDIFRGISLFEKLMTCNNPSIDMSKQCSVQFSIFCAKTKF